VQAFSLNGLVIGPLVFSLLMSIIAIYKRVMPNARSHIAPAVRQSPVSWALLLYMFRPQPTHHAHSALRSSQAATGTAPPRATLYQLWGGGPRGVSVFAEQPHSIGAARAQKRRRRSTPARACRVGCCRRMLPPPERRHVAGSGFPR
jgi:hypothetical protein